MSSSARRTPVFRPPWPVVCWASPAAATTGGAAPCRRRGRVTTRRSLPRFERFTRPTGAVTGVLAFHRELRARGRRGGRKRVARVTRTLGFRGRTPRRFRRTTDSRHTHRIAPNVLRVRLDGRTGNLPSSGLPPDKAWACRHRRVAPWRGRGRFRPAAYTTRTTAPPREQGQGAYRPRNLRDRRRALRTWGRSATSMYTSDRRFVQGLSWGRSP